MYYITNQNNQVIAADTELLALLGIEGVEELYKKAALEELTFTSASPQELSISVGEDLYAFTVEDVMLSGMLGELTLNVLTSTDLPESNTLLLDESSEPSEDILDLEQEEEIFSLIDDEPVDEVQEEVLSLEDTEEASDFEPISIIEEESEEKLEMPFKEKEEALEIPVEDKEEELEAPEEEEVAEKKDVLSMEPITIDVTHVSQVIGISTEEYGEFLNEFIDNAISLEKELKSDSEETKSNAVQTLVKLSEVLHIPEISESAKNIGDCSSEDRDQCIEILYNKLARLTTQQTVLPSAETVQEEVTPLSEPEIEPEIELEEEVIVAPEMEAEEEPVVEVEAELPEGSFGTIDLDEVNPIHFDFRLEEAADELSLPVELIEEFVHDFIDQANSETKNILEAYKQGDLDKIQKIGHLLKGASSNLRINPLADTLYEIQFCEDSSKLEGLIKNYWAHFIAFEKQMELTSK